MDPNLYRLLASGAFPSPLPSPQESVPMLFPMSLYPQPMQQELLRQMACQQLLYQHALNNLMSPMATAIAPKAVSPVLPSVSLASMAPQQLTLPTKLVSATQEDAPVVPQLPKATSLPAPQPQVPTKTTVTVLKQQPQPQQQQNNQALVAALTCSALCSSVQSRASPESPSADAHCSSPSTSSNTKDDEEDLFVDVESVDNKIANKDRRKAHVEFFRKVKSIRQRTSTDGTKGERSLTCAICNEKVPMQDNAIQLHVNLHADAGGFRCQLCGFELKEKSKVYNHMRDKHPTKVDLIEDRRNMTKLSAYIEVVFPRAYMRPKKDSTKEVDILVRQLDERKLTEVSCALCEKMVVSNKSSITRHANQHPSYRCKSCKYTTDSESAQEQHQTEVHSIHTPRLTGEYNLCTATDVIARQIHRCFSHALQQSQ